VNTPLVQQRSVVELIDRSIQLYRRRLDEIVDRFRNTVIVRALELNRGNIVHTSNVLGIDTMELKRWMDKYGIT
jgi:DNA-binding NtrC family response regulator